MTAIYTGYTPKEGDDKCPVCLDPLENKYAVAHGGDGRKHPFHLECIKDWAYTGNETCPSCRAPTDNCSLFTWKERSVTELKYMGKDALDGMALLGGIAVLGITALAVERGIGKLGLKPLILAEAAAVGGMAIAGGLEIATVVAVALATGAEKTAAVAAGITALAVVTAAAGVWTEATLGTEKAVEAMTVTAGLLGITGAILGVISGFASRRNL